MDYYINTCRKDGVEGYVGCHGILDDEPWVICDFEIKAWLGVKG